MAIYQVSSRIKKTTKNSTWYGHSLRSHPGQVARQLGRHGGGAEKIQFMKKFDDSFRGAIQYCTVHLSDMCWKKQVKEVKKKLGELTFQKFQTISKTCVNQFFPPCLRFNKTSLITAYPTKLEVFRTPESISKVVNSGNLFKTSKLEWVNTAPVQKYLVLVFVFGQRLLKKISQFYLTVEHKHIPFMSVCFDIFHNFMQTHKILFA